MRKIKNATETITLDFEKLELLTIKTNSAVYRYISDFNSSALKRVASNEGFEMEARAMQVISEHKHIAKILAFDARERYLLIAVIGILIILMYLIMLKQENSNERFGWLGLRPYT